MLLEMPLATGIGQQDLLLTFAEPLATRIVELVDTLVTRHAVLVLGARFVLGQDRLATGMAQLVRPLLQSVTDGHAPVKDETLTIPKTVFLWHLFEVLQNTALEVVDILDTLTEQEIGRFLTANPTGTEHRDPFVVEPLLVLFPPLWKFAKRFGFRVDGVLERADPDLIIIARVDHGHIIGCDQLIPFLGRTIMSHGGAWIDVRLSHCDNLALEAHLHAAKWLELRRRQLELEIRASGQGADMRNHAVNRLGRGARDGAVNALARQKQRPRDPLGKAQVQKRLTDRRRVVEAGEVIEGANCIHAGFVTPVARRDQAPTRAPVAIASPSTTAVKTSDVSISAFGNITPMRC